MRLVINIMQVLCTFSSSEHDEAGSADNPHNSHAAGMTGLGCRPAVNVSRNTLAQNRRTERLRLHRNLQNETTKLSLSILSKLACTTPTYSLARRFWSTFAHSTSALSRAFLFWALRAPSRDTSFKASVQAFYIDRILRYSRCAAEHDAHHHRTMAASVDAATRKRVLKVIFVSLLLDLVSQQFPPKEKY